MSFTDQREFGDVLIFLLSYLRHVNISWNVHYHYGLNDGELSLSWFVVFMIKSRLITFCIFGIIDLNLYESSHNNSGGWYIILKQITHGMEFRKWHSLKNIDIDNHTQII